MKYFPGSAKGIITTFRSKHFNNSYSYSMNCFVWKGFSDILHFKFVCTFLWHFWQNSYSVLLCKQIYTLQHRTKLFCKHKTDEKEVLAQFPQSKDGKSNIREVVGFSHNPFSTSVPQEENLEGRREALRIGRYWGLWFQIFMHLSDICQWRRCQANNRSLVVSTQ